MAEDQARSARESAASSSLAARATVDQAQSSRESVQLLQREQDRADRPEFEFTVAPLKDGVRGVMDENDERPPSIAVTVDWISESSCLTSPVSREVGIRVGSGLGEYTVVRDEQFGFPVDVPPGRRQGAHPARHGLRRRNRPGPDLAVSTRQTAERPFVG